MDAQPMFIGFKNKSTKEDKSVAENKPEVSGGI
jgi:hypothetical protein